MKKEDIYDYKNQKDHSINRILGGEIILYSFPLKTLFKHPVVCPANWDNAQAKDHFMSL